MAPITRTDPMVLILCTTVIASDMVETGCTVESPNVVWVSTDATNECHQRDGARFPVSR